MLLHSRQSGALHINAADLDGVLFFDAGDISHAEAGERIGLATVYRTLGALAEHGIVDTLSHNPLEACYRLCGEGHHHHLVCSECHRVVELAECGLDQWLDAAAASADFVATAHRVEVVGVCSSCRAA